jgi:hypothetical protein
VILDPATGELVLDEVRLGPRLKRPALIALKLGGRWSREGGPGWSRYELAVQTSGKRRLKPTLEFERDRFDGYELYDVDPKFGASWDDAPPDGEKRRRAAHDAWLKKALGPPHERDPEHFMIRYRFAWGEAWSAFDPRSYSSSIGVRFKR